MKKIFNFHLVLLCAILSSCTTYQYSARQVSVNRHNIGMHEQMNGVQVDYSKQVTATSEYQLSRQDAIAEAEYLCIQKAKIDVVVDPIVKVEYNPFKVKKRYKATIVGFAGKYKEEPTRLDKSKEYTLEEIEKYKLLYDPSFPQYYYNKGMGGDRYYFGANGFQYSQESSSFMIKTTESSKELKVYDFHKALQLRNAGIGLMAAGTGMMMGLGLSLLLYDYETYPAGIAFMTIGGAAIATGVPMLAVGCVRAKNAQKMDITLNAGANGLGVGLTF